MEYPSLSPEAERRCPGEAVRKDMLLPLHGCEALESAASMDEIMRGGYS